MRHTNSLESNSMTQEVAIQFPATFAWHLFYLGKSLFACNRWNHGTLKPKCDVPRGQFTMGNPIYRAVCNRTYCPLRIPLTQETTSFVGVRCFIAIYQPFIPQMRNLGSLICVKKKKTTKKHLIWPFSLFFVSYNLLYYKTERTS